MIRLENLTKSFTRQGKKTLVADKMNMVFPSGASVALLGRNGAGKSTLLRMIAGTIAPSSGRIVSTGSISWPVGFSGSFHKDLTGVQNVRFIARIYGVDTRELVDYVADFAELGAHFHAPFGTYSSGMKSRLAMGTSMGIKFDTYLVDEVTSVGDAEFRAKSQAVFRDRMSNSGAIVVTHSMPMVRNICDAGAVLDRGKLTYFEDLEEAISYHQSLLNLPPDHKAGTKRKSKQQAPLKPEGHPDPITPLAKDG